MGGESKQTQTQQASVKPLDFTIPGLENITDNIGRLLGQTGITGTQQNALQNITQTAQNYQPQFKGILDKFLSGDSVGGQNAMIANSLGVLQDVLKPIAQGNNLNVSQNPYLQDIVTQTQDQLRNDIGARFAAAGRPFSPAHMNALGNALGDATNRLYYNAYNDERDRQFSSIQGLLNGSIAGSNALDQSALARLGVQQTGSQLLPIANAGDYAALDQEAANLGIPTQNLGALSSLLVPIASLGRDVNSTGTTVQKDDPFKTILGGGIGLLGSIGKFF